MGSSVLGHPFRGVERVWPSRWAVEGKARVSAPGCGRCVEAGAYLRLRALPACILSRRVWGWGRPAFDLLVHVRRTRSRELWRRVSCPLVDRELGSVRLGSDGIPFCVLSSEVAYSYRVGGRREKKRALFCGAGSPEKGGALEVGAPRWGWVTLGLRGVAALARSPRSLSPIRQVPCPVTLLWGGGWLWFPVKGEHFLSRPLASITEAKSRESISSTGEPCTPGRQRFVTGCSELSADPPSPAPVVLRYLRLTFSLTSAIPRLQPGAEAPRRAGRPADPASQGRPGVLRHCRAEPGLNPAPPVFRARALSVGSSRLPSTFDAFRIYFWSSPQSWEKGGATV